MIFPNSISPLLNGSLPVSLLLSVGIYSEPSFNFDGNKRSTRRRIRSYFRARGNGAPNSRRERGRERRKSERKRERPVFKSRIIRTTSNWLDSLALNSLRDTVRDTYRKTNPRCRQRREERSNDRQLAPVFVLSS